MAVILFTDFGAGGPYVGQVELAIEHAAPGMRVVHLYHEAPAYDILASAHLLDALLTHLPRGHVVVAVVDPGVGTERRGAVVQAAGLVLVGPDNGLLSLTAQRWGAYHVWHLPPAPATAAPTFHGRDLFAPAAARVAAGRTEELVLTPADHLDVCLPAGDLAEVIQIDTFGNATTGLRARHLPVGSVLELEGGARLTQARTFADRTPGEAFWYENSIGLAEIAVSRGHAAQTLGLAARSPVRVVG